MDFGKKRKCDLSEIVNDLDVIELCEVELVYDSNTDRNRSCELSDTEQYEVKNDMEDKYCKSTVMLKKLPCTTKQQRRSQHVNGL